MDLSNDKALNLISDIVNDNRNVVGDCKSSEEFLSRIKDALEDGEYLSTLNTDEDTVNDAYALLEDGLKLIEELGIDK